MQAHLRRRSTRSVTAGLAVLLGVMGIDFAAAQTATFDHRLEDETSMRGHIHLFGGNMSPGAPLAAWYRSIGISDVWLYPVRGVFPQDQSPVAQKSISTLVDDAVLSGYAREGIRYWWFERPVPDYFYYLHAGTGNADFGTDSIWGSSSQVDHAWNEIVGDIASKYSAVRDAGFAGIVFDAESYYSYAKNNRTWLWEGHGSQLGLHGNYYLRGLQIGKAIKMVWPEAKIIMVYGFGYEAEYWWYRGFRDAGIDLYIAVEHTYGAGPTLPGQQWYQHWWSPNELTGVVQDKLNFFSFLQDASHVIAGLFPIDFGNEHANYGFTYFSQQLRQARDGIGKHSLGVWIWPQGPFSHKAWMDAKLLPGDDVEDYWKAMSEFSSSHDLVRKP